MVLTDLVGLTTTWLNPWSLLQGTVTANLDQPSSITADMRSNDPAVNTLFDIDDDPLVAQSNRLLYVFLRLNAALPWTPSYLEDAPWQCVASGIVMQPQDQADADSGATHLTAWDAWQYLNAIPCFLDGSGAYIGSDPLPVTATADVIALQTLQYAAQSIAALGLNGPQPGFFGIDMPESYGGTSHYTGTVEVCPELDYSIQQGTSVGTVWTDLCTAGDDEQGTANCIDIVLEPIWDPVYRPGYTAQVSVYNLAGTTRPAAVMAWGSANRSSSTADRTHDASPGQFVNIANFYTGQAGYPVFVDGQWPNFAASISALGPYVLQQFFPDQPLASMVNAFATLTLSLQKQGKRTFTVDPDPTRSSVPFLDYFVGDRVPVLAPAGTSSGIGVPGAPGLRTAASGIQRVQTIPLQISPDGVVTVQQLQTCPDWPGDSVAVTSLSPTSGAAGDTGVTVNCSGFAANAFLALYIGGYAATVTAGGNTNGAGSCGITFTIPSLAAGVYTIYVTDGASPTVCPSTFTVT